MVGTAVWLRPGWVGLVGGVGWVTAGPGLVGTAVCVPFVCVGLVRAADWAVTAGPGFLLGTAVWVAPGWAGLVGGVGLVGGACRVPAAFGLIKAAAVCAFAGPGLVEARAPVTLGCAGLPGEPDRPFAGLGLVAAPVWPAFV